MLKGQSIVNVLIVNVILGAVWHYIIFFFCISIKDSHFDPERKMYRPSKWEKGGKIYNDVFLINKWKDSLPQHIGKDGFSKEHIDDLSIEYIDEFIIETCRAEWDHTMNCLFTVALFILNDFFIAFVLTFMLLLGNLPFAFIQRYNRFRLQKLRKTLVRRAQRDEMRMRKASAVCSLEIQDNN